jgi:hypothetical protein
MAYLRLLRTTDLKTIVNQFEGLFGLPPPSRRALEETVVNNK